VRLILPARVALWAGGNGVGKQRFTAQGVNIIGSFSDLNEAVLVWRSNAQP